MFWTITEKKFWQKHSEFGNSETEPIVLFIYFRFNQKIKRRQGWAKHTKWRKCCEGWLNTFKFLLVLSHDRNSNFDFIFSVRSWKPFNSNWSQTENEVWAKREEDLHFLFLRNSIKLANLLSRRSEHMKSIFFFIFRNFLNLTKPHWIGSSIDSFHGEGNEFSFRTAKGRGNCVACSVEKA